MKSFLKQSFSSKKKVKKAKLYLSVFTERSNRDKEEINENKRMLLNANKIAVLQDYLPTEEILKTHFEIQRINLLKDKEYEVKPFVITVEVSIFMQIIENILAKGIITSKGHVALYLQYPGVPCCLIKPIVNP